MVQKKDFVFFCAPFAASVLGRDIASPLLRAGKRDDEHGPGCPIQRLRLVLLGEQSCRPAHSFAYSRNNRQPKPFSAAAGCVSTSEGFKNTVSVFWQDAWAVVSNDEAVGCFNHGDLPALRNVHQGVFDKIVHDGCQKHRREASLAVPLRGEAELNVFL